MQTMREKKQDRCGTDAKLTGRPIHVPKHACRIPAAALARAVAGTVDLVAAGAAARSAALPVRHCQALKS